MANKANEQPTYLDVFDALLPPLRQCTNARIADLEQANAALTEVTKNSCTGVEHWRDRDTPNATPKLYINHRTNQTCPIHGTPNENNRLRIYVGCDPEKITAALAAIALNRERVNLRHKETQTRNQLGRAAHLLRQVYIALDFTYPEPEEPKAYTIPNRHREEPTQ